MTWLARHCLYTALAVVGGLGCGSSPRSRSDPQAVHVEGAAFRDGLGRQLLFRGYNIRAPGLFDVTFDDGRRANEDLLPFGDSDALRMEQLGFNVVRLPVNWSAIEPQPRQYSAALFARLDEVLELLRQHRLYAI